MKLSCLIGFMFVFLNLMGFSKPIEHKKNKAVSSHIINIGNPDFRPLKIAVPSFVKPDKLNSNFAIFEQHSRKELSYLLNFTEIFSVVDPVVYQTVGNKKFSKIGSEKVPLDFWQSRGVDTVLLVNLSKDKKRYILYMRTIDINQKRVFLRKKYRIKNLKDFSLVAKRYIDALLTKYTNKSGIFFSKIVFVGKKTKSSLKQIYTCDIDGSNVKKLTRGKFINLSPSWGPKGRSIVYTSFRGGKPNLYSYNHSLSRHELLSDKYALNSGGSFSPYGDLVAFTGAQGANTHIFALNTKSKKNIYLTRTSGIDVDPSFSPDGKWLAFVSERYGQPHIIRGQLHWSKENTKVKLVSHKRLTYKGWYNTTPAWSPDSKKIAFSSYDNEINRFDVFTVNYDGTELSRLTLKSGDNENPTWSPNGQLIMFSSNRIKGLDSKGTSQIYIMKKDGSNVRKIDLGVYEAYSPKWSTNVSNF